MAVNKKKQGLITKAEADKIRKQNAPTVTKAKKLEITTVKGENRAYEDLKVVKDAIKFIEGKRTKITSPLNASLREVNAMFKELSAPLKEADTLIRGKILGFHTEQKRIAAKEEAKRNKIRKSHQDRGHKVHAPAIIEPEVGKSTTQKRWVFDVISIKDVPVEYLVVDTSVVNAAIKDGIRKIDGLNIFQKESLSVR